MTITLDAKEFGKSSITRQEFELILSELILDELNSTVVSITYTESGVEVETSTDLVEIEIDWQELILNE
jgi:hypothetical protein